MVSNIQQVFIATLCIFLTFSVVLYGLRFKDIASLSSATPVDLRHHHSDESSKLIGDLHHHADKQVLKSLLKHSGDNGIQIDARSLRILKEELRSWKLFQVKSWLAYLRTKLTITISLL